MTRLMFAVAATLMLPVNAMGQPAPPAAPDAPAPPAPRAVMAPPGVPAPPEAPFGITFPRPAAPLVFTTGATAAAQRALEDAQRQLATLRARRPLAGDERQIADAERQIADAQRAVQDTVRQQMNMNLDLRMDLGVGSTDYDRGLNAFQSHQYDRAITYLDRVIAAKGAHVDGALYWKAYASSRLGKSEDALAALAALTRDYPKSRYLSDARVLETDVRRQAGQPVDPQTLDANDDIKLYAISGIANSDPDRALPLLEGVLTSSNSPTIKKRAIYVLALSADPRAHAILLKYAKGAGNPDVQADAIHYLASRRDGRTNGSELRDIYLSTQDAEVRRSIIDAYRGTGGLLPVVVSYGQGPGPAVLRTTVRATGNGAAGATESATAANSAAAEELWGLYQQETDASLRGQMLGAFASLGAVDKIGQIARSDKDADVRMRAIRSLGGVPSSRSGQALGDLYTMDRDRDARRAVIQALASQNNAEGLVAAARKETDPTLKLEIVKRLSDLAPKNKAAADYLMEVIK